MQDTIFTVELPLIETNEELEKIKGLYPRYDSYFIASGCCKERREKFDKLWAKYKPYADRHFLNQFESNPNKFSSETVENVCWKCIFKKWINNTIEK